MGRMYFLSPHHVFIVVVLFVSIYFATLISTTAVANHRLEVREHSIAEHVGELRATNASLKEDVRYYTSTSYVQYAARNQLALMMPGDHVLRVAGAAAGGSAPATAFVRAPVDPDGAAAPKDSTSPMWLRWWNLLAHP